MLYYHLYYYYLTILALANSFKIYFFRMAMSVAEPNSSVLLINMFIKSHFLLVRVKFVRVKTSTGFCNLV